MELIGNTLDEIANEKSGIIKKGVPCIIGPTCLSRKPIFDRA
jgi:dihydrofolate synthase/folylpolyglutamate synthase